jgi:hypothetical protein
MGLFKDKNGPDVRAGYFERPLQGNVQEVFRFKGHVTQIGQFLECPDLRCHFFDIFMGLYDFIFENVNRLLHAVKLVGTDGQIGGLRVFYDGFQQGLRQGNDVIKYLAEYEIADKGREKKKNDEHGKKRIPQDVILGGDIEQNKDGGQKEKGKYKRQSIVEILVCDGQFKSVISQRGTNYLNHPGAKQAGGRLVLLIRMRVILLIRTTPYNV